MSDTETIEWTNELKQMGGDEYIVKMGQRELVKATVQQQIFCQVSGRILDMRTAVLTMGGGTKPTIMDGKVWDEKQEEIAAILKEHGHFEGFEVYDARELY